LTLDIFNTPTLAPSMPITESLDIILSDLSRLVIKAGLQLQPQPKLLPWRISTYLTGNHQIVVSSKEEALARFKQSNLLDCKISSFPYPVPTVRGINAQVPDFFISDIDRKNFKTYKLFHQCLQDTLQNYKTILHGADPTILWTGGGYQLLQPLDADIILEMVDIFKEFDQPSMKLMRYLERLMTDGKCDPVHNNTVSFGNCMIRIPGSYNSKYVQKNDKGEILNCPFPPKSEVKFLHRSDGYTPNIRWVLEGHWTYLIQERNDEALRRLHNEQKRLLFESRRNRKGKGNPITDNQSWIKIQYGYIDKLLQKPLDDFRKYCTTFLFTPYFINTKKLSQTEAFNLTKDWLDRCSSCKRLDFNASWKINNAIKGVKHYPPKTIDKLKVHNNELYKQLQKEGIITH
jgi:Primase X